MKEFDNVITGVENSSNGEWVSGAGCSKDKRGLEFLFALHDPSSARCLHHVTTCTRQSGARHQGSILSHVMH